jgi:hypothetical protein
VVLSLAVVDIVKSLSLNHTIDEETSESGKEFLGLLVRLRFPLLTVLAGASM